MARRSSFQTQRQQCQQDEIGIETKRKRQFQTIESKAKRILENVETGDKTLEM